MYQNFKTKAVKLLMFIVFLYNKYWIFVKQVFSLNKQIFIFFETYHLLIYYFLYKKIIEFFNYKIYFYCFRVTYL